MAKPNAGPYDPAGNAPSATRVRQPRRMMARGVLLATLITLAACAHAPADPEARVTNPATYVTGGAATIVRTASSGLGALGGRAGMLDATDSLEKMSLDYYATLRSISAQRRAALVAEGKAGGPAAPDKPAMP